MTPIFFGQSTRSVISTNTDVNLVIAGCTIWYWRRDNRGLDLASSVGSAYLESVPSRACRAPDGMPGRPGIGRQGRIERCRKPGLSVVHAQLDHSNASGSREGDTPDLDRTKREVAVIGRQVDLRLGLNDRLVSPAA